jgi:uncharacterized membrane protein YdbT with pleckstrin-like domain
MCPKRAHPGGVSYPDKLLADDEEVVAHLHPHALTVFWPIVRLLLIIGAASFGMAMVPAGSDQGVFRLVILGVAALLVLVAVVRPLLRWRTTHYVITTHRLLFRTGALSRSGRDIALARITDVSFAQTLWERIIRSGTLRITSAGEGATVLYRVPGSERVQQLLNFMIEEDADRRAQENAGYLGDEYRRGRDVDGFGTDGFGTGGFGTGGSPTGGWGHPTTGFHTNPV